MTAEARRAYTTGGTPPKPIFEEILGELGFREDRERWSLFLPLTREPVRAQLELRTFEAVAPAEGRMVMGMRGVQCLADRRRLWTTMVGRWGKAGALELLPRTYLPQQDGELERLADELEEGRPYILKGGDHLRRSLHRSVQREEILSRVASGVHVVQPVVDGLRLEGRRFSMRLHLLLVATADELEFWLHPGGWLYYTLPDGAEPPEEDRLWIDVAMPLDRFTPAADPELRRRLPFSLEELWPALDRLGHDATAAERRIQEMMVKVARASGLLLGPRRGRSPHRMFRLLGLDVLLDPELRPYLIEANYGPRLDPVLGALDREICRAVVRDGLAAAGVLGPEPGIEHRFRRIWRLSDAVPLQGCGWVAEERQRGVRLAGPQGETLDLNETGALIWSLCRSGASVAVIVDALAEGYDAPRGEIAADVVDLLRRLGRARAVRL